MRRRRDAHYSLRRRLLGAILGISMVLWIASLTVVAVIAWRETNDVFDDALKESGYLIMAATTDWKERDLLSVRDSSGPLDRKVDIQYQLVLDGKVIQRTGGAPSVPFVSSFPGNKGFANVLVGDQTWRIFITRSADRHTMVQVGHKYSKRKAILREFADHLLVPATSSLLLLGITSWFFIRRLMRPIQDTATSITEKSHDDLTLLGDDGLPAELLPIIHAVNGMLARLDAALQAERRFTADAAHELRTPLAGVHMHLQLLQRLHPELASSFQKLRQDAERSTRLVDSLLALARLDPIASDDLLRTNTPLAPLLDDAVRAHLAGASERGITIDVQSGADAIFANSDMLRVVLRNLVDNALRYGGSGCTITIDARWHDGMTRLSVCDDGPGVTPEDRARLAERFFRVLGSGQSGSGLGLSIVRRIVDLHGAVLHFGAGPDRRGLHVMIDFPTARPAPQDKR